jgi:hypothetical protein
MSALSSGIRVCFFISLVVGCASCGASSQSSKPSAATPQDPVENSAKRIAGQFVSISTDDSYGREVTQPQIEYSFDVEGNFKRRKKSEVEEGVYLITPKLELVLYVEKINGEQRAAAKLELYRIVEERDDGFILEEGASRKIILRKR